MISNYQFNYINTYYNKNVSWYSIKLKIEILLKTNLLDNTKSKLQKYEL